MGLIIGLLALWLLLVIVGITFKALLWLAIIGLILFVATGIYAAMRNRANRDLMQR